jgi:DNA invertase Pin-like site-specific DNA recombinase
MTTPKPLPFVAYRRVSTRGQVDRYGLSAQDTDLRAYAKRAGVRIIRTETDGALTGTLPADERPGLLAALRAIKAGEAAGLLIPSLDRLARELGVQEAILGQVWDAGGIVHSAETGEVPQDDPEDPMRTAMRQMRGVFAQLDRALIIKRMRNGRKAKAAEGGYAYGAPAFGKRAEAGELVSDPAEAEAVALILAMHGDGKSTRTIAAELDSRGMRPKRGERWHSETVRRVIVREASKA